MKHFNIFVPIVFCVSILTVSCDKEFCSKDKKQTVNVNLKVNDAYQYELGLLGDEEGAVITRQAKHFLNSLVERDISKSKVIYKYQPSQGFIGSDEVVLESKKGSDGGNHNKDKLITTIKFTITN